MKTISLLLRANLSKTTYKFLNRKSTKECLGILNNLIKYLASLRTSASNILLKLPVAKTMELQFIIPR